VEDATHEEQKNGYEKAKNDDTKITLEPALYWACTSDPECNQAHVLPLPHDYAQVFGQEIVAQAFACPIPRQKAEAIRVAKENGAT
jgi:hypothetical protein